MMGTKKIIDPVFLLMIVFPYILPAHLDSEFIDKADTLKKYIITTTQEMTIIGTVMNTETDPVIITTEHGTLTIPKDKISKIKEIHPQSMKKGKYWFPNPNTTRLFFAPTARTLEKGEAYFADYYLFFPSVSYGFSNNFTLNAGLSIIPGFSLNKQFFYLAPKIGISAKRNWHFAAGGLFVHPGDSDEEDPVTTVGILYGVTTYGNNDSGFTFGLGYGFSNEEFVDSPAAIFGGEKRISRKISFVTENWIIPYVDPVIVSYGLRFMSEKMAVDLAFITALDSEAFFPGIPMLDFVYNF